MTWADRLRAVLSAERPDANSAKSANSPAISGASAPKDRTAGPIGTIGTIGIHAFAPERLADAANDAAQMPAPADNAQAGDEWQDRRADALDGLPDTEPPRHPPPPADLVERLAQAEAALPWQRAVADSGMIYLRSSARHRLARLDPMARELLVQHAEARSREHGGGIGG